MGVAMRSAEDVTLIASASTVLGWDADAGTHVYLADADVAFAGDTLVHVGAGYAGPAARRIDGRGLMVLPGLVNAHTHPATEPGNKGLLEDLGSPRLGQSNLYEFMPVFRLPPEAAGAAMRVAVAESLRSGVTTFVDWSLPREGWADELAATGVRGVLCPMYRSARWKTGDGHSVDYEWDEAAGERELARSVATIEAAMRHPSGRLHGMLGPAQVDTCTPALLRESLAAARRLGVRMHLHAAQSLVEFGVITRRHGRTPVEHLDDIGVLCPDLALGHGIFVNDHPWLHWPDADDFALLARSGAGVTHCPVNFSRRGIALNTLRRYVEAGIPVALGTDTFPHDLLAEMRTACLAARIMGGGYAAGSTRHAFDAATVGGAHVVGRDDIGRLAPGAHADLVLVDLAHPDMRPAREPLRSLVHSAGRDAVREVFVHGEQVVRGGEVLTIDVEASLAELEAAQRRMLATVAERDWAGRDAEGIAPPVYPWR